MTKNKHPANKAERLLINEQKKKNKDERAAKVWRKLQREQAKDQETADELQRTLRGTGHYD